MQSAQELEEKYGDVARTLAVEHSTAYKLCGALRKREPPVFVSDGVAKMWLSKYRSVQKHS